MKYTLAVVGLLITVANSAASQNIYLLSKRQIVNSTHTIVVLFHDESISTIADCQREIQRGNRGQWRYYQHNFPRPVGYSESRDYLCIDAPHRVAPWYDLAPYDLVYQIDVRSTQPRIKEMPSLAACLNDLRKSIRDETRMFFCGKLSQKVSSQK